VKDASFGSTTDRPSTRCRLLRNDPENRSVVTGVTLVTLIGAVVEGDKMWAAPGIIVPLGAVWIATSSATEQHRSPGPGRLVLVGGCVVAGVVVFMSLMRLAVQ
jgi:hypothetical protein